MMADTNMNWRDVQGAHYNAPLLRSFQDSLFGLSDVALKIKDQFQRQSQHEDEMAFRQKQLDEHMREFGLELGEKQREFNANYGLDRDKTYGIGDYSGLSSNNYGNEVDYSNYDDPRLDRALDLDFKNASAQHNHPEGFMRRLAITESGGDHKATSKAGAKGLMQFMPATAKHFGIDPTNPSQSIWAASRYMAELRDKYGGYRNAAIAYNWGEGNLQKWLKSGGKEEDLPKETRNYVRHLGLGGPLTAMEQLEQEYNELKKMRRGGLVEWERKDLDDRLKQLESILYSKTSDSKSNSSGTSFLPEQGKILVDLVNEYRNQGLSDLDARGRAIDELVLAGVVTPTQGDHALKNFAEATKEAITADRAIVDAYASGLSRVATSDGAKEFIDKDKADDALLDVKQAVRNHPQFSRLSEKDQDAVVGAFIKAAKEGGQLPEEGWIFSDPRDRIEVGPLNGIEKYIQGKKSWTDMIKSLSDFDGKNVNEENISKENPTLAVFMDHLRKAGIMDKVTLDKNLGDNILAKRTKNSEAEKKQDEKAYQKKIDDARKQIEKNIDEQTVEDLGASGYLNKKWEESNYQESVIKLKEKENRFVKEQQRIIKNEYPPHLRNTDVVKKAEKRHEKELNKLLEEITQLKRQIQKR